MYSIIQLFNRIFNSVDNEETDRATLSSFFSSSFCNETLCLYAKKKCDPNLKPILRSSSIFKNIEVVFNI